MLLDPFIDLLSPLVPAVLNQVISTKVAAERVEHRLHAMLIQL